jgi:hypothetical protein
MIRASALLVTSVVFVSCSALPTEQQLIGKWRMPVDTYYNERGKVVGYSKQMAENTLNADHTYTSTHQGVRRVITGHWRLSGRWLIYEFATRDKGRTVVERHRDKILKLSERTLVLSAPKEGEDSEWTKVR